MKVKNTRQKLISNFLSLSSLQMASYIFPLLTIPYLVRVVGVENYGLIAFAGGVVFYFNILVAYGFGLTATKEISVNRDNTDKLSKIFSSVITTQLLLLSLSFMILLIMLFFIESISNEKLLYIFSFIAALSNTLFPIFFFQGMEQMKYITIINILSRMITTLMIFIVIRERGDYYLVPAVYAFFTTLSTAYSIYFIKNKFNIKLTISSFRRILKTLKDGRHIFISNIGITLYDNTIIIILGFLTSMTIVGYFTIAQKLIKAIISVSQPIYKTVYPHIMLLASESKDRALDFIRKVAIYSSLINISIFIITDIFADKILLLLFGDDIENSILVLQILSILPLIVGLNNIIGVQTLIAFHHQKFLSKLTVYVGLISLPISFIIIHLYSAVGAAIVSVLVEVSILAIINIYLLKNNIKIFTKREQNE